MFIFFFFNDTATTEIYTLSLHDALPIWRPRHVPHGRLLPSGPARGDGSGSLRDGGRGGDGPGRPAAVARLRDRKSTRLNSSHANISYAVFCLKKKKHTSAGCRGLRHHTA